MSDADHLPGVDAYVSTDIQPGYSHEGDGIDLYLPRPLYEWMMAQRRYPNAVLGSYDLEALIEALWSGEIPLKEKSNE